MRNDIHHAASSFLIFVLTYRQGSGNLRLAVQLPEGEDLNEWLAVHSKTYLSCAVDVGSVSHASLAVDFFNHLNMLYGTVTEFCTREDVSFGCWILYSSQNN